MTCGMGVVVVIALVVLGLVADDLFTGDRGQGEPDSSKRVGEWGRR